MGPAQVLSPHHETRSNNFCFGQATASVGWAWGAAPHAPPQPDNPLRVRTLNSSDCEEVACSQFRCGASCDDDGSCGGITAAKAAAVSPPADDTIAATRLGRGPSSMSVTARPAPPSASPFVSASC